MLNLLLFFFRWCDSLLFEMRAGLDCANSSGSCSSATAERERERYAQAEQPNTNNHTKDRRKAQGKKC